jgi:hypothetical protein
MEPTHRDFVQRGDNTAGEPVYVLERRGRSPNTHGPMRRKTDFYESQLQVDTLMHAALGRSPHISRLRLDNPPYSRLMTEIVAFRPSILIAYKTIDYQEDGSGNLLDFIEKELPKHEDLAQPYFFLVPVTQVGQDPDRSFDPAHVQMERNVVISLQADVTHQKIARPMVFVEQPSIDFLLLAAEDVIKNKHRYRARPGYRITDVTDFLSAKR